LLVLLKCIQKGEQLLREMREGSFSCYLLMTKLEYVLSL
jgi:hypothetical protein